MPFNLTKDDVIAAGVRINYTNDDAMIADMETADRRFLKPILGSLLTTLLTSNDAKYTEAKQLCKRAEAFLAYWADLPSIQTQISDKGVTTNDSQNGNAAHRWEFNELREMLADKGCWNLEDLLDYLYSNGNDIGWVEPDYYTSIIRTGREFDSFYTLFQPYRTFNALRAVIKNVEEKYIITAIGREFLISLRDYAGSDPDTLEAIRMTKQAVAFLSVYKATKSLRVRMNADGFTVLLSDNSDSANPGQQNVSDKQLAQTTDDAERDGGDYLEHLTAFLDKKASTLLFPLYFTSEHYTAPPVEVPENPNANRAFYGM